MGPIRALWDTVGLRWRLPADPQFDHLRDVSDKRRALLTNIERSSFQWRVVVAAGAGIFTASYNLAATYFVLPILTSLYWPSKTTNQVLVLEMALVGMLFGQVIFGFLADRFGRRKLSELAVTYAGVGILGFAQSSSGLDGSMAILGWLCFWRFVMGIGLGAQYPLAAVITAEFAPSRHRSTMMATVFSMQSFGSLAAALITFAATKGLEHTTESNQIKTLDRLWRIIAGVGAIPAFITALFLFTIPESPRYTFDVKMQADQALETMSVYTIDQSAVLATSIQEMLDRQSGGSFDLVSERFNHLDDRSERSAPGNFRLHYQLFNYLVKDGNWRYFLGMALCWFLLNLAFYGLDSYDSRTTSFLWDTKIQTASEISLKVIVDYSARFMLTVSVGSVVGSIIAIKLVEQASRKSIFNMALPALAVLYVLTGVVIMTASDYRSKIIVYAFNFVITAIILAVLFMYSAEIFPLHLRGTFSGASIAAGTLGSIVFPIIYGFNSGEFEKSSRRGIVLISCAAAILLALPVTLAWLPEVQNHKSQAKSLEELAKGIKEANVDGQVIGFRKRLSSIFKEHRRNG